MAGHESSKPQRRDKRIERTEKAIYDAFFRLLEDNEYDRITISALAREAGIDRKTFYLHYASIDELSDSFLRERSRAFVESLIARLDAGEGRSGGEAIKIADLVSAFCRETQGDISHLRSQVRHIPLEMMLDRLPDILTEAFVEDGRLMRGSSTQHERLCVTFVAAGIAMLFRRWVLDADDMPPMEEVAELANVLVFEGVNGVAAMHKG